MSSNEPLSEQFLKVANEWVASDAAATLLEDTKSAVFSQKLQPFLAAEIPVNRAEHQVRATPEWIDHVGKVVEARKNANFLKVKMKYFEMRFGEWNSEEANNRTQARL